MVAAFGLERFRLSESNGHIVPEQLVELLRGESAGYLIKGLVDKNECERILQNFHILRAVRRQDSVPGMKIGAFHYGKTTDQYFDDVSQAAPRILELVDGTNNPIQAIHREFAASLSRHNLSYRTASSRGRIAGEFVARMWNDVGQYALAPHEDAAQLMDPAQADFEIQAVAARTVVGVNLCIKQSKSGGALVIWNSIPDANDRRDFGVQYSGYPYPLKFASNFEALRVQPEQGDLYCVNGNFLHAVDQTNEGGVRLTLSFICGQVDPSTVIHWT